MNETVWGRPQIPESLKEQLQGHAIVHLHDGEWARGGFGTFKAIPASLSAYCTGVYVETPRHLREMFSRRPDGSSIPVPPPQLHVWRQPWWLPRQMRNARFEQRCSRHRIRRLQRWLKARHLTPIVYVWHPELLSLARQLRAGLLVYHIYDEFLAYEQVPSWLEGVERELLREADLVVACSNALAVRKAAWCPDIEVVPNGVYNDWFQHPDQSFAVDLSHLPRPRVGYVGAINQKVNLEALLRIARDPNLNSLVLVGDSRYWDERQSGDWRALREHPAVTVMGKVDPRSVPSILNQLDVGIAPYRADTWADVGSSVKVFEYLAAGIPVVATRTRALTELDSTVSLVSAVEEWAPVLTRVLTAGDGVVPSQRIETAAAADWGLRARQIASLIGTRLSRVKGTQNRCARGRVPADVKEQLRGHAIVHLRAFPWSGGLRSSRAIPMALADYCTNVYVEPPKYWRELVGRRSDGGISLPQPPDLHVWRQPLWLPQQHRVPALEALFSRMRVRRLERWLEARHLTPIVYIWDPWLLSLARELRRGLLVYHCYDQFLAYEEVAPSLEDTEGRLLQEADIVIACSSALAAEKDAFRHDIEVVPNGVFNEWFRHPDPAFALDISHLPGPRVGYVGSMNPKLDLQALIRIADHPSVGSLVLVGDSRYWDERQSADWELLSSHPRVTVIGEVDPRSIPSILEQLHVGIAPYRTDTWADVGSPVKIYEYLAAGLPVVAARTRVTVELESTVSLISAPEEWASVLTRILTVGDRVPRAAKEAVAASADWRLRAQRIASLIANRLR